MVAVEFSVVFANSETYTFNLDDALRSWQVREYTAQLHSIPVDIVHLWTGVGAGSAEIDYTDTLANEVPATRILYARVDELKVNISENSVLRLEISHRALASEVYNIVQSKLGAGKIFTLHLPNGVLIPAYNSLEASSVDYVQGIFVSQPQARLLLMEHRGLDLFSPKQSVPFVNDAIGKTSTGPGRVIGMFSSLEQVMTVIASKLNGQDISSVFSYDPVTQSHFVEANGPKEYRVYDITRYFVQ